MLMDETYQTLEALSELGRTDVELTYNTNVTTWTHRHWDAIELWKEFSSVLVMASIDGTGDRGAYIRKGLKEQQILANLERLREECPHVRIQINFTLGLMNALHLPDVYDFLAERALIGLNGFVVNPIQEPVYLAVTTLPESLKAQVRSRYEDLARAAKSSDRFLAKQLLEAVKYMDSQDTSATLDELKLRTSELDDRRGEDFAATFPELVELTSADGRVVSRT